MSDVLTLTDLLNRLALMITTSIFKVQINIYRGSVLKGKKKTPGCENGKGKYPH